MTDSLVVHRRGEVAELVLNAPRRRNAISYEMWSGIPDIVEEIDADDAVKVLVVRGEGDHFSAGADISEFEERRSRPEDADSYNHTVDRAERALAGMRKPTVAMIRGYCIGGGCEIALACDLRFAASSAKLGITPSKLGLVYSFTATKQLSTLVGPSFAKYILFSGLRLDSVEALRVGLVDQVAPDDELASFVDEFVTTVCSRSQVSVQGSKRMVNKITDGGSSPDDEARDLQLDAIRGEDYSEGVRAFLEKRDPVFTAH